MSPAPVQGPIAVTWNSLLVVPPSAPEYGGRVGAMCTRGAAAGRRGTISEAARCPLDGAVEGQRDLAPGARSVTWSSFRHWGAARLEGTAYGDLAASGSRAFPHPQACRPWRLLTACGCARPPGLSEARPSATPRPLGAARPRFGGGRPQQVARPHHAGEPARVVVRRFSVAPWRASHRVPQCVIAPRSSTHRWHPHRCMPSTPCPRPACRRGATRPDGAQHRH